MNSMTSRGDRTMSPVFAAKGQRRFLRETFAAEFVQPMDFKDFPCDHQRLSIVIIQANDIQSFRPLREIPGQMRSKLKCDEDHTLINWKIVQNKDTCQEVDVDFTLTDRNHSSNKEQYNKIIVKMYVYRRFRVWLWTVLIPLGLITTLVFTQFAIGVDDNHDKMAICAALLLAIVALKFNFNARTPVAIA